MVMFCGICYFFADEGTARDGSNVEKCRRCCGPSTSETDLLNEGLGSRKCGLICVFPVFCISSTLPKRESTPRKAASIKIVDFKVIAYIYAYQYGFGNASCKKLAPWWIVGDS